MNQTPNLTHNKHLLMIDKAAPSAAIPHPALVLEPSDLGRYGLPARIILSALSRMALGALRFRMPDGKEWIFGGGQPEFSADIRVQHLDFFKKVMLYGDVGFGESFVDGDWETDDISAVISFFILNIENWPTLSGTRRKGLFLNLFHRYNRIMHLFRDNTVTGSRKNIRDHYDLSNDFFKLFLDPTLTYSAAYWERPDQTLEEAQVSKYDRLCRQLRLKPSDHLLEIGSGWGGFSAHAASKYGCRVTTVTVSEEQHKHASQLFRQKGLERLVDIRLMDYRDIRGQFDKIASVEMLEAVGDRHLETYFAKCHEVLKKDGLLALQYIICPDSRFAALRDGVDWIQKHIFPGSLLLSIGRVNRAINRTGDLFLHNLEDLGAAYARTLGLWHETFNRKLDQVRALGFDDRFIRKWNYYLEYCKAAFAMHNISVVQALYTRPGNHGLTRAR